MHGRLASLLVGGVLDGSADVATSFGDLDARRRRRLVARSLARMAGSSVALVVLYAVVPVPGTSGLGAVLGLVAGLLALTAVIAFQVRAILHADHPALRAVESLVVAAALLISVFAFTYVSVSEGHPTSFSEPLDRVGAMYFTVTVLGTVGFGDIAPRSDGTRLLVTAQMLVDLVLVVGIVRTLVFAARLGVQRRSAGGA